MTSVDLFHVPSFERCTGFLESLGFPVPCTWSPERAGFGRAVRDEDLRLFDLTFLRLGEFDFGKKGMPVNEI